MSSTAALGLIALTGVLRLPPVAALGHLSPPLLGHGAPVPVWASAAAAALLAAVGGLVVRAARRHLSELRAARREAAPARPRASCPYGPTTGRTPTPCPAGPGASS
ncbi:hypothetical protein NKH77_53260 [Streptomyces sp. M19]